MYGKAMLLQLALALGVQAHSIWIEADSSGYRAYFGEIEEGKADTLEPAQGWSGVQAWGLDGKPLAVAVAATRLDLATAQRGMALFQDRMPVHGEGAEAGRGIFLARFLRDSVQLPKEAAARELDLRPVAQDRWTVELMRAGKPLPGHEIAVRSPDGKSVTLRTDAQGRAALPSRASGIWQLSSWIEVAGEGSHLGKAFAKTWHVASLGLERR